MMQYHFHDLFESIEFEQLARDVVQIRDRIVLETFAKGPDSGMDGRFVSTDETVILQVKNYEANNFASLLKSLKQEREKLERIRIDRYILVLSVNLTPKRKAEIQDLFQPYITIPSDIITEDDLNNLLGQAEYKCVMEKYNQLWLGNREALRTMLSETVNGILLEESEEEYQASLLYSGTFVRTKVFEKALSILSRRNVLVISGEPGVGKTALARQLGIFYTQFREYDKFIWVHSVDDLYRAQRLDGKKVVVFDDFWGSNFYRYFSHDSEEKRLAVLIERIAYRGDFTLILTTREYVLAQGLEKNPEFRDIVRRLKLECRIQEYSIAEKAQIFFRLLKKSDLNWSQTEILFSNSKEIVDHAKYNPRVIDMFLKTVDIEEPPDECEARFFDYLESPTTFWESIFTALSKDAQIMFLLFSLSNLPIGEEYAKKTYASYLGFLSNASEHKSYNAVVIELEKTVIETFYIENENLRIIKFQNPSAIDFIHTYLRERIANYLYILMDCCYYYEQLINLLWISEHVLSYEQQITLLRECIDKLETQPGRKSDEYYEFLSDSELEYYEPSSFTQTDLAKYRLLLSIYVGLDIAEFSDFFKDYFVQYHKKLDQGEILMSHDDLVSYSDLVMEYRSAGYALDGMEVLKRYFNQVKLHMIRPFLYYFKEIFPEEYKQFLEEEKEELRNYLFFYYEEVMMDFIDEDESITSGEALIRWAKYDFQEYRLDGIQSLCSVLEEYMTYLEDITEVIDNDTEMLNKENLDYNEIIYAAKRDILREESVFDFEDCQNRIIYSDLSDATKTELLEIYETESPWYIYEFMKCNESFTVLKKVAQKKFMIHRIDLFYSQIVCEFAPEIKVSERQFIIFMFELCNLISCRETLFLSKKEVLHLDAYQKFFSNDSKPLDHFVASGVLCKNGKWYMPAHVLMVLIPYAMCVVNQPLNYKVDFYGLLSQGQCKRYNICQNINGEIEQEWYTADMGFYYFHRQDWEEMLYKLLFDLDEENFVKHFVNPAWTAFYKEIDGREDSAIRFMEKLGLGYHIKRGENNPYLVMNVDSLWLALCSIDVVDIWNILLIEFSTVQLDYVELNMQEENNIYYIKIDRDCPEEFIELLGLREKITDIIDCVNNFLDIDNSFA